MRAGHSSEEPRSRPRTSKRAEPDPFERLRENVPKQARSRETLTRLLDATEQLLDEGGLDAATVPAIAERAGVSVGVVYRRFPDKDNLLRAVYQRFFGRVRESNLAALNSVAQLHWPLNKLMRAMVRGAIEGQRRKRNIIRSLVRYARTHRDPSFRRAAIEMNRETMKAISVLMMSLSQQMKHPKPEHGVEFAMLTLGAVMQAAIVEEDPLYKLTTEGDLEEELIRLVFRYLGIKE